MAANSVYVVVTACDIVVVAWELVVVVVMSEVKTPGSSSGRSIISTNGV
jgi:hypothetical protein